MRIATTQRGFVKQFNDLWDTENELKWKRAALVYAIKESGLCSTFADLSNMRLKGVSNATQAKSYYLVWQVAIETGIAQHVGLGDALQVPTASVDDYWNQTPQAKFNERRRQERNTTPSTQGEQFKGSNVSVVSAVESHTNASSERADHEPRSPYQKATKTIECAKAAESWLNTGSKHVGGSKFDENSRLELIGTTQRIIQKAMDLQSQLFAVVSSA